MKPTFGKHEGQTFAYCVDGIQPGFHTGPFGRTIGDFKKAKEFRESNPKVYYVDAKHRATLAAVKEWVKEHKPTQFWAVWKSDSSNYKDDSVEVYYVD